MYFLPSWPQDKWEWMLWIAVGLLMVGGLVVSYWRQSREAKEGLRRFPGLCNTVQKLGIKAALKDTDAARAGMKPEDFEIVQGTWQFIEFTGTNVNFLYFFCENSGDWGGKTCYLYWTVKAEGGARDIKETVLTEKWSSRHGFGRLADVEWEGDDFLAARLNADHTLQETLLRTAASSVMSTVRLSASSDGSHYIIKTVYIKPSAAAFAALDRIAGHLKSL